MGRLWESNSVTLRFGISLLLLVAALVSVPASASAYSSVLRPNVDMTSTGWSVVGASTAWEALDDPVIETEEPSNADYITTTATTGSRRVGMSTTRIGGATIAHATAWWYMSAPAAVEVQVYGNGGGYLAKTIASGIGWHSLEFKLSGSQVQVDALYLDFHPSGFSATRSVSAAFVCLNLEPRVMWGAWMDGDVYTKEGEAPKGDAPWTSSTWEEFNKHASKNASIVHFGQPAPWAQKLRFDEVPLKDAREGNAIPMVDMDNEEPLEEEVEGKVIERRVTLSMIANHEVDGPLEEWAEAVAAYGYPFFFRWDWEMNGNWFEFGREAIASPKTFVAAWRRFHEIAEAKGATNITWVWCPNIGSTENTLSTFYPGSAYVDWTCMDGYNHGTNPIQPSAWTSFSSLFLSTYNSLLSIAPEKPIMIGETASTESGGSKASWISDAFETQLPISFPKIKAVVWFNWNIKDEGTGLRWDWPIESSGSAQAAFANAIASPYYSTDTFGSLPALTRIQPLP